MPRRVARLPRAQFLAIAVQLLVVEIEDARIAAGAAAFVVAGPFGRQVVLTGGGAELKGIADYMQGVLGRAVRIGRPNMPGLPEAHSGPAFSTLAGLAQFAASDELDLKVGFATAGDAERPAGNMLQRLIAAFRTQY